MFTVLYTMSLQTSAHIVDIRVGVNELQFYDPAGYGEVYSIDQAGNLALQTTQPDWGTTFSKIVPGWGRSYLAPEPP